MRALLLLACLAACDTGDAPSATLVAHYAMDDVDGNRATDSSGNDHHGMCTTCPALVAGKKGMAYSFDGGDQQVDVIENPAFTLERGMSVAAWVKVDAMPATIPERPDQPL